MALFRQAPVSYDHSLPPPAMIPTIVRNLLSLAPVIAVVVAPHRMALRAQDHRAAPSTSAAAAPAEARQFDFLIGHWELEVTPKVNSLAARIHGAPKLLGSWKAWKAFDGFGIQDELRILDRSGNPVSLSSAMRAYSEAEGKWLVTALDVYRGRFSATSGRMANNQFQFEGQGLDPDGKPVLIRSRFVDMTATAFKFVQDRSSDGGKSWDAAVVSITAKRIAASAPR